jgi:hypothetical protein
MNDRAPHPDRALTAGTVALVSATASDRLLPMVVLSRDEESVTGVPVSPAVRYASEWDLQLSGEVLGYPAIAEVWNFGSILPEQCRELVGVVAPPVLDALQQLSRAALAGDPVPEGLPVGPPVLADADPRLVFQDAEAEAAHPFWEPALALSGVATLGQLVRHRREALAVAPTELEMLAGGRLDDLEHDKLDLRRALPAAALGALLRRLQLGASARLRAIARSTVEAGHPAVARGARSIDPAPDADAYVDAVFAALEDDRS